MRIPLKLIPQEIIHNYKLLHMVSKDYVYVEINKGMYGLPQAGLFANKLIQCQLAKYRFYQASGLASGSIIPGAPSNLSS
jgi:hypothetical protein